MVATYIVSMLPSCQPVLRSHPGTLLLHVQGPPLDTSS